MLVQLVNYNSLVNNSAVNTTTDQQNIVQVASNLLEEENTRTWLYLQQVCEVNLGLGQTSNFSGEVRLNKFGSSNTFYPSASDG